MILGLVMGGDARLDVSKGPSLTVWKKVGYAGQGSKRPLVQALAHYMMGIIYDNEGGFDNAIKECDRAIRADPEAGYIRLRLAACCLLANKPDRAVAELEALKAKNPEDVKPRFAPIILRRWRLWRIYLLSRRRCRKPRAYTRSSLKEIMPRPYCISTSA